MIITRTPFRISFFGGGTDYPVWYRDNGGSVLATTIDKYCYISCRYLPPFFDHKFRIVYSFIENTKTVDEIKHPAVRAVLQHMDIRTGLEIHHDGDVPARAGLGSSSSFTVGLIHALYALQGRMTSPAQLSEAAIHVERHILKEAVGSQDQVLAAHGGFCKVEFLKNDRMEVIPVLVSPERLRALEEHCMLFYTGLSRYASEVAAKQIENTPNKTKELAEIGAMVNQALDILAGRADIGAFGELLHESWLLKRSLSDRVSTPAIDELYQKAREAGALGGKITGAGGGGFLLLIARPEDQPWIERQLGLLRIPFRFEHSGSKVIVYQPEESLRMTSAQAGRALSLTAVH